MRSLSLVVTLLFCATATAREYAPRVVSAERADAYSMRTFAEFPRWRNLRGDALAWEVYRYLADTESGLFHMNEVLEGGDVLSEYRTVRDPVKIINVYGYAYCAVLGPVMAGIWEDMGQGPARTITLPDWSHVASEVFYDDGWHYMDLDLRAVFRRDDLRLASLDEARRDASLWRNSGPLFFPNDSLERTRRIYQRTRIERYYGFNQGGHTMDYVLRHGETFTRWWTPQGGRWHHAPEYNRQALLRQLIEQTPRGPKPNHRHFTVHNHGNGRFVYRPDLTARSTDFADGAYDLRNVRPTADGLRLVEPGEGYVVFEVRSPYVIVPLVGSLETDEDDREASVIQLNAQGVSLALSRDIGLTWLNLDVAGGNRTGVRGPRRESAARVPATLDLTRHVRGTYGYLLRITLRGSPNEAVLRRLGITTWVQLAPAALPALAKGNNRMEYRTGDHHGLNTRVVEIRSEANRPESLLKYLVDRPAEYDPSRNTGRIRGEAVAKIEAPPGTRVAWFAAQGSFATHQREAARKTRNTISYAVDEPRNFRDIYRADVPADADHWHSNARREVKLENPARRLFVRYLGDPALNNFHIYAHCLDDGRRSAKPVRITHTWREGAMHRSQSVDLDQPGAYQIVVESQPVNESVEIAVPSGEATENR